MMVARGDYLIFADADGASDIIGFEDLLLNLERIKSQGLGVAVGSRNHLRTDIMKKRSKIRDFLNFCQVTLVKILCNTTLNDTQCGFKLFTKSAAISLFIPLHIQKWAFDVELVYLCGRLNIPIVEVPIPW